METLISLDSKELLEQPALLQTLYLIEPDD